MDYALEYHSDILESMSLEDARKLMHENAINRLNSWYPLLEFGSHAILYSEKNEYDIDENKIPFIFNITDLLDCEVIKIIERR